MRLIGLTGTIASGKSTAARRLRELGAHVIDADAVSRAVLERGTEALLQVKAAFGELVMNHDGTLNRRALGEMVFCDAKKMNILNGITHPAILANMRGETRAICAREPDATVVWDAALLIETGLHVDTDEIWLVTAPDETRIMRMQLRDGMTRRQAVERINAQMSELEKREYVTAVINNVGTKEDLYAAVDELWFGKRNYADGGNDGEHGK